MYARFVSLNISFKIIIVISSVEIYSRQFTSSDCDSRLPRSWNFLTPHRHHVIISACTTGITPTSFVHDNCDAQILIAIITIIEVPAARQNVTFDYKNTPTYVDPAKRIFGSRGQPRNTSSPHYYIVISFDVIA